MNLFRSALIVTASLLSSSTVRAQNAAPSLSVGVAMKTFGNARFTCLADGIIRMEYDANRRFEDRPTFAFIHRDRHSAFSKVAVNDNVLRLDTPRVSLTYTDDGQPFNAGNLRASFQLNGRTVEWTPGADDSGNLRGTCRTLDGVSGATHLNPGLLSRDGWAVVDESDSIVLEPRDGRLWPAARDNGNAIDWYLFAYGHDYKTALADFANVSGHAPIPPRYAFGAWWSRYWAYSADELRQLADGFDQHKVPLDVLVIDMDWHLDGWTGYTWNPKYFPDPEGFLKEMHQRGLKTTLNLHPADGVGKHERQFPEMCRAMGLDPEKTDRVPFDCTDPKFVDAYFRILHHPLEKMGIDFWWMDWQQGTKTKIPGLDPLPWINYLHWMDQARREKQTHRRPLNFSRWGGLGNHRYPIGFSGDTFSNWASLAFQTYFTATAGNVGFGYWSHDIGGHQPGPVAPELYTRWIQFGAFSPILRTHTTKNPKAERRIWKLPPEMFDAAKKAFELRYHLLPYIYTAARESYDTGLPLCRPLYYEWPEFDEAYAHDAGYLFGDAMLVAPVARPADPATGEAPVDVWLPPGRWRNGYTGRVYEGPTHARLTVPLDEIPVFVRDGYGLPAMPKTLRADEKPIERLIVHVFPQPKDKTSTTTVYEDDYISAAYLNGAFSRQTITSKGDDDDLDVTIFGAKGNYDGMPTRRAYEIHVENAWPPEEVKVDDDEVPFERDPAKPGWHYEPDSLTIVIRTPEFPIRKKVEVELEFDDDAKDRRVLDDGLRGMLRILRDVADILGDATPAAIANLNSRVNSLAAQPARATGVLQRLPDQWPSLVAAVANSKTDDVTRQKALVRIMGLVADLHVDQRGGDTTGLDATLDLATTVKAPGLDRLSGTASIAIDPPWRVGGESQCVLRSDHPGADLQKTWPITLSADDVGTDHVWQTTAIRLHVKLDALANSGAGSNSGTPLDLELDQIVLPSINAWWIVGPFDGGPQSESLAKAFPPEDGPIDLNATYKGKDGQDIHWRKRVREVHPGDNLTWEFLTDFDDFYGHRVNDAVAYAVTWIEVPEAQDAVLAIGSDDGIAVWLNGKEVHRNPIGRPYTSKQDRVSIHLNKGINELRVKINQGGGDWAFAAHVETPEGKPIPGLRIRMTPPE